MKIAVVSMSDASDGTLSSGAPTAMVRALQDSDFEVFDVSPLHARLPSVSARQVMSRVSRRYDGRERGMSYLRRLAHEVERRVTEIGDVDIVFSTSTLPITCLSRNVPYKVVATTDQLFINAVDSHYVSRPNRKYIIEGETQERSALSRCDALVVPSPWAAFSAVQHYGMEWPRVHTIPWGANLSPVPGRNRVLSAIEARGADPEVKMLFVGKDWDRKGGPLVLETVRLLRERGLRVSLTVIGSEVSGSVVDVSIPMLDRTTSRGEMRYHRELEKAHLLFVPSRAEAYGHVFCEAAAFGVPSVTTDVGGIGSIVLDKETGICLSASSGPDVYADAIEYLADSRPLLLEMSRRSRQKFETQLSWDIFARDLKKLFDDLLSR